MKLYFYDQLSFGTLKVIGSRAELDKKLKELDRGGVFEKDDEVGVIFQSILKIQEILNEFNLRKFS